MPSYATYTLRVTLGLNLTYNAAVCALVSRAERQFYTHKGQRRNICSAALVLNVLEKG